MASLCLNSLPLVRPSSFPRKLTETCCSSSSSHTALSASNNGSTGGVLKPIVINGDPPTFVSAPGRRIVADLHGDLDQTRSALEMAGVLIQLGDILDRGEDEIAILSLLRSLDVQAKAQGGAVFQVNGNHETINVEGDFRYVEPGAFDESTDFMEYLDDSKYDWENAFVGWIRESKRWRNDRKLFQNYWDSWNLVKRQKGVIARSLLFRPGGPLACELARHGVVLKTLTSLGAKAMVVGHTPQTAGANCIWRIDVGMSSGVFNSRPEVLEIKENEVRVIRRRWDAFSELEATLSFSGCHQNGTRELRLPLKNAGRSRILMSVSVGSSQAAVIDDAAFADYKPNFAFLFPGQGAQAVGMGKEAQSVAAAAELYKRANDILGYDLLEICTSGPKEKLDSTVISQPAIYVTSLAAVELLRARDGGQQEAADAAKSAMVSVIGLDSDKVQLLCDAANEEVDEAEKVQIANYLCPGNYAVSGGLKGVEAVEAKAKSFKARMTVRLAVAGAFHTRFMEPAVSRLEAALAATEIRSPRIPVISNVDAQPHADPATIKKILARQVTSPVQWETTVKTLLGKGLKKSYELGPGKVIAGIVKRVNKGAEIENISA
ncbi:hypothetical protein Tsubulata_000388 [Turnera subulata]|uniref:Malonyl-CoA:ACP transacylase (MAT) domain-containing protein n=2 Tax=Magnoliopsida TaxID=3398 RepID=A0A9Q0FZK3_9ROSI|nr:hypothetical protein Tsubulata_000388 [Turnera subulata]